MIIYLEPLLLVESCRRYYFYYYGASSRTRTCNLHIKSVLLYQLSYGGIMVLVIGLEPTTLRLQGDSTANCATPAFIYFLLEP